MCSFMCLAIPWYFLEWPTIEALNFRDQFTFWVLFANAACALVIYSAALLIIKRTSALTYWVAGEVRGWTMEVLSSKRTLLNTISYAIGSNFSSLSLRSMQPFSKYTGRVNTMNFSCSAALGGAMICSYSTRTDNPGPNLPADGSPQERTVRIEYLRGIHLINLFLVILNVWSWFRSKIRIIQEKKRQLGRIRLWSR